MSEPALAPAFQQLLEDLLPHIPAAPQLTIAPEYRNPGVGRPDIALVRPGEPARAFVELKALTKPADPKRWRDPHDRRQFDRLKELACWGASNFAEFRLLERADETGSAIIVPARCLDPDRDNARIDREIGDHDFAPLVGVVSTLCLSAGQSPTARNAEHLATLMAHSARLVRGIVQERLSELNAAGNPGAALLQVRQEFRDVLYSHPEAGGYSSSDFDTLFSAAFAQTLAFGLQLVREATGAPVGVDAWQHMPGEHPLMRTALRVLSLPEVLHDVGIGFDIMRDTVNSFGPEILALEPNGRDPILYFYENFLRTFDPEAREKYGVYYTPVEVVQYMVGALDRTLREHLGTEGLRDPRVTILDPATGTGTFLLGIAERVRKQESAAGEGMAALALQGLAGRMFGFELLVGPYAVAHYRLHHTLRRRDPGESDMEVPALPRLGVYLADTLAEPGAAAPAGPLGFVAAGISDERREANRIKAEQPILAIIGNPPYRRLEEGENRTLVGDWLDRLWDDLKEPVRDAGEGNQLNTFPELSVAFWRWAMWKTFEAENAPKRGVVAFISNRKYLTGWPYAGLRKMMRERFDRIEIIDLRGDVRRGERAGVEGDQGVFNIMVGTAITVAIADGSAEVKELAQVHYHDAWGEGLTARTGKLAWLLDSSRDGVRSEPVPVRRGSLEDMRPLPFTSGAPVPLQDCFMFRSSGIETARDDFAVGVSHGQIADRITAFQNLPAIEAAVHFPSTKKNTYTRAYSSGFDPAKIIKINYRPFDIRRLYDAAGFIDWPRPVLRTVWGTTNCGMFAMAYGTGFGPAVWACSELPDRHTFRGSTGGYVFPRHDNRPGRQVSNLSPTLLAGLSAAYGELVAPDDVFDAILCLLSASSYTTRFAEDLEDVFPHVPFPARLDVFRDAARVGAEIRAVETFARPPSGRVMPAGFVRIVTQPREALARVDYADGSMTLCADGSGKVTGLPADVWRFSVSGYRVLPRWLEARIGLSADLNLVREFRDVCGRIAELVDLFAEADTVLESALHETLTRDVLGFAGGEHDPDVAD